VLGLKFIFHSTIYSHFALPLNPIWGNEMEKPFNLILLLSNYIFIPICWN
jgi:hypothetical protein